MFAMDEKESLRPDDSASIRAVEEEDAASTRGSVVNSSRVQSDVDARAFRDQLREISGLGFPPRQAPPMEHFQPTPCPSGNIVYAENQNVQVAQPVIVTSGNFSGVMPTFTGPAPDSKLLEALNSPKDRLWVLKLEQDLIDFMKDPSRRDLDLPQSNSFYRMLAHRLADYYLVNHVVDDSGMAVRLYKTMHSRMYVDFAC